MDAGDVGGQSLTSPPHTALGTRTAELPPAPPVADPPPAPVTLLLPLLEAQAKTAQRM
jgi:hypothetical protein